MLKFLRIAVTALILTACVLLVALWVRSYWWIDAVYMANSHCAVSMRGNLNIDAGVSSPVSYGPSTRQYGRLVMHSTWKCDNKVTLHEQRLVVPVWMLTLLIAATATVPWIPWRFSLRTLLIVTTLVAVGMGVIVAVT